MSAVVQTRLEAALNQAFDPEYLTLENESSGHGGFYPGKESHFKLVLVTAKFSGMPRVRRHQSVYAAVHDELTAQGGTVHALALHLYTPEEWQGEAPQSPHCRGGSA